MKLITLNTWGGVIHKPLLEFLARNKSVDIFCFQEVYHNARAEVLEDRWRGDALNLHSDIADILVDHVGYFRPSHRGDYGLSTFVKKDITVSKEGDIKIHEMLDYAGGDCNHPRNMQHVELVGMGNKITIANAHGLWNGRGKTDTQERLEQSRKIKEFMDSVMGKKILCGDFNLLPNTESLKMLEIGMRNLVHEYGVRSTRTSLYTKPEKFADYIFASPDVKVVDFKVLPDEVSDHSPLLVEFE